MNARLLLMYLLLQSPITQAAFFMDANTLQRLLTDFEAYQENREIRYMAKASQFVGYVTGVADASDGRQFCLPGGIDGEQTSIWVAQHLRLHARTLPRHATDAVTDALKEKYPCRQPAQQQ